MRAGVPQSYLCDDLPCPASVPAPSQVNCSLGLCARVHLCTHIPTRHMCTHVRIVIRPYTLTPHTITRTCAPVCTRPYTFLTHSHTRTFTCIAHTLAEFHIHTHLPLRHTYTLPSDTHHTRAHTHIHHAHPHPLTHTSEPLMHLSSTHAHSHSLAHICTHTQEHLLTPTPPRSCSRCVRSAPPQPPGAPSARPYGGAHLGWLPTPLTAPCPAGADQG